MQVYLIYDLEPPLPGRFSEVFVFWLSGPWLRSLATRQDYVLRPVLDPGKLWRLDRTSSGPAG